MKASGRVLVRLSPLAWFAAFLLLLAAVATASAEKVTFSLDWVPYGKHAGFYVALDQGFYRKAGLDVTIERGYGSPDTAKKVAAKSADFGFTDPSSVLLARSQKLGVRQIAMIHGKGMLVVFALKGSGIHHMKDLEGRRIGETIGGAGYATFQAVANANGIKKWEWVGMRPAAKNPSLLSKKVDAIITYIAVQPALRMGARKQGEEIVTLLYSDYGVNIPADGLATHDETIRNRPDVVRRFVEATLEGMAWGIPRGRHEAAMEVFLKHLPETSRDLGLAQWKIGVEHMVTEDALKNGLGHISPEQMDYTYKVLSQAYKLDPSVSMAEVYTNGYLPTPPIRVRKP
ncbi:MAG: ABC transporter substrate-binding protein [Candidatus Tectomicrobia bacterium]|nr:ABC transporter substrate-binding protein [Candidatus Tectomicrobia bacterium]